MLHRAENFIDLENTYIITHLTGTPDVIVMDPRGELVSKPWVASTPNRASERIGSLADIYLEMGPGTYTLQDIQTRTGVGQKETLDILNIFDKCIPDDAFFADREFRGSFPTSVRLGNLAVASRLLTVEERAKVIAKANARTARFDAKRTAILEAESEKTNLATMDHALIRTSQRDYYLPLNSRTTISNPPYSPRM